MPHACYIWLIVGLQRTVIAFYIAYFLFTKKYKPSVFFLINFAKLF
jgi:hypothetical protein